MSKGTDLPGTDVLSLIDAARRAPDATTRLIALLAEQSTMYSGRGATTVERLRGYILAAFETVGLPVEAEQFVLEELETGLDPYAVAGAARALRGAAWVPDEAPLLLVSAIARLRGADEYVSFTSLEPVRSDPSAVTSLVELARTLAVWGPRARSALPTLTTLMTDEGERFSPAVQAEIVSAMTSIQRPNLLAVTTGSGQTVSAPTRVDWAQQSAAVDITAIANLEMQDQDGTQLTLGRALGGRPAALGFFYTRCTNPQKCSLTITLLARTANRLAAQGVDSTVTAITYDPGFDRPPRLRSYGADRGMAFSDRCRLLRTVGPFDPIRAALQLGVGYGPVTVNRHRLDLLILDAALAVRESFERRLWTESSVINALRRAGSAAVTDPAISGMACTMRNSGPLGDLLPGPCIRCDPG